MHNRQRFDSDATAAYQVRDRKVKEAILVQGGVVMQLTRD